MSEEDIVIVSAKRTPMGAFAGNLSSLTAPELAAFSNKAAIESANIKPSDIDEVIFGCVLQAGIGQAPARQGAKLAGIPDLTPATTINKMCGSGMKAVMFAVDAIRAESAKVVLAGGMESMSNSPYLVPKARNGLRMGHHTLKDSMFLDGLEDAYEPGQLMGVFADETAKKYQFSREDQDAFAKSSMQKALNAQKGQSFLEEIVDIEIKTRKSSFKVSLDESPDEAKLEKISRLKAAFSPDGTVTAANASSISDGASSLILTTRGHAKALNLKPLAKICGHSSYATEPEWFTTAPIGAMNLLFEKINWHKDEVDLFEINEAFAVVTMAAIKELDLDEAKVNVNGGACALGHPIGASGARILTTLIHALKAKNLKKGIASLCIGGGEATAMALEIE